LNVISKETSDLNIRLQNDKDYSDSEVQRSVEGDTREM